ncbi:ATP/DNA binding protein [Corchorus olitorius]|uniref:ATP/DNA binding protein n=1 Tax=Corchorus olitorius TaxID=93759 RepID=A0A1R3H2W8_9ROSI|nr:ATP/DNA binding protein [Corchorus olitorius]
MGQRTQEKKSQSISKGGVARVQRKVANEDWKEENTGSQGRIVLKEDERDQKSI